VEFVVKVVLFIRRKSGWTREDFRQRYEQGHAPLAARSLPLLRRYVRNYVESSMEGWEPDFDAVTEFWFDSMEDWNATKAWVSSEEGQVLARDEEVFMHRETMRFVLVEEEASRIG
jgi:uncharacterized protein (TIGR02118 family)